VGFFSSQVSLANIQLKVFGGSRQIITTISILYHKDGREKIVKSFKKEGRIRQEKTDIENQTSS
jgi:hypothetical protein